MSLLVLAVSCCFSSFSRSDRGAGGREGFCPDVLESVSWGGGGRAARGFGVLYALNLSVTVKYHRPVFMENQPTDKYFLSKVLPGNGY